MHIDKTSISGKVFEKLIGQMTDSIGFAEVLINVTCNANTAVDCIGIVCL